MNILFDLDGTLTDPFEGITKSVVYALEGLGVEAPSADDLRWVIGPPLLGSLETLLGDKGLATKGLRLYRERLSEVGLFENCVYGGIPEVLEQLQLRGHLLFVATSKPTVYSVRILEKFGLLGSFRGVYGSELDGTRTDKSELIEHLLRREALEPTSTMMVGDRSHDIVGAKTNGIDSIGVLYGYGSREELETAGATLIAESPGDVRDVFDGRF